MLPYYDYDSLGKFLDISWEAPIREVLKRKVNPELKTLEIKYESNRVEMLIVDSTLYLVLASVEVSNNRSTPPRIRWHRLLPLSKREQIKIGLFSLCRYVANIKEKEDEEARARQVMDDEGRKEYLRKLKLEDEDWCQFSSTFE